MATIFARRFDELCRQADAILAAKTQNRTFGLEGLYVDQNELINWQVKVRNLLSMVCGSGSQHFLAFERHEKPAIVGDSNYKILLRQRAVLIAARDDFEGGYVNKLRDLITAEVFDSELDQAQELFTRQLPFSCSCGRRCRPRNDSASLVRRTWTSHR